jgi:hypothetical protein
VSPDPAHQPAQTVAHLYPAGRLARPQDHAEALPARGIVDVDRQGCDAQHFGDRAGAVTNPADTLQIDTRRLAATGSSGM